MVYRRKGETAQVSEMAEDDISKKLLFNKWDMSEVQITDPGLVRYITSHINDCPSFLWKVHPGRRVQSGKYAHVPSG